jgi:hypothetical protein
MKKIRILSMLLGLLIPVIILAHPPSKVIVTYDQNSKKIHIVADHNVKDPTNHFVITLDIKVDGKEVNTLHFTSQTDKLTQVADYDMPDLKAGQEVEVKATCCKMGSKTGKVKI